MSTAIQIIKHLSICLEVELQYCPFKKNLLEGRTQVFEF